MKHKILIVFALGLAGCNSGNKHRTMAGLPQTRLNVGQVQFAAVLIKNPGDASLTGTQDGYSGEDADKPYGGEENPNVQGPGSSKSRGEQGAIQLIRILHGPDDTVEAIPTKTILKQDGYGPDSDLAFSPTGTFLWASLSSRNLLYAMNATSGFAELRESRPIKTGNNPRQMATGLVSLGGAPAEVAIVVVDGGISVGVQKVTASLSGKQIAKPYRPLIEIMKGFQPESVAFVPEPTENPGFPATTNKILVTLRPKSASHGGAGYIIDCDIPTLLGWVRATEAAARAAGNLGIHPACDPRETRHNEITGETEYGIGRYSVSTGVRKIVINEEGAVALTHRGLHILPFRNDTMDVRSALFGLRDNIPIIGQFKDVVLSPYNHRVSVIVGDSVATFLWDDVRTQNRSFDFVPGLGSVKVIQPDPGVIGSNGYTGKFYAFATNHNEFGLLPVDGSGIPQGNDPLITTISGDIVRIAIQPIRDLAAEADTLAANR